MGTGGGGDLTRASATGNSSSSRVTSIAPAWRRSPRSSRTSDRSAAVWDAEARRPLSVRPPIRTTTGLARARRCTASRNGRTPARPDGLDVQRRRIGVRIVEDGVQYVLEAEVGLVAEAQEHRQPEPAPAPVLDEVVDEVAALGDEGEPARVGGPGCRSGSAGSARRRGSCSWARGAACRPPGPPRASGPGDARPPRRVPRSRPRRGRRGGTRARRAPRPRPRTPRVRR